MIAGVTYELTKTPTQVWKVRNFKHNGLRKISTPIRGKLSRTSNDVGVMANNVALSGSALNAVFSDLDEIEGGARLLPLPFEEVVAPGDINGQGVVGAG